jgi:hypothetical protein
MQMIFGVSFALFCAWESISIELDDSEVSDEISDCDFFYDNGVLERLLWQPGSGTSGARCES